MISICIASYNYSEFYPALFQSLQKQTRKDFEVLLGIDGSQQDLQSVKQSPPPAKVIYFPINRGKYTTANTLAQMASREYVLFFDADDIMFPHMIEVLYNNLPSELTRYTFRYQNTPQKYQGVAHGSFLVKRSIFLSLNGFKNWPISADTEFMERSKHQGIKEVHINQPLFYYVQHKKSLTNHPDTSLSSELRRQYAKQIKKEFTFNPPTLSIHKQLEHV